MPAALLLAILSTVAADPTAAIRAKLGAGDWHSAEAILEDHKRDSGENPEYWKGASWLARGALSRRDYKTASAWAARAAEAVEKLIPAQTGHRKIGDANLEIALGAAYEVTAQSLAASGKRAEAVAYLERREAVWGRSEIGKRLRKNLNALTLTRKSAPPIAGEQPKTALLFFWAHYCGDCKAQAPVVLRLAEKYAPKGLRLVAPTQLYGSVGDKDASPADESAFIEKTWIETYAASGTRAHPVDAAAMLAYGVSTTPTLALVDAKGIVRLYRPGRLTEQELDSRIADLLK